MTKCRYCGLHPIDLHHLLPKSKYPQYGYHVENIVPLCVNVHAFITRRKWSEMQEKAYERLITEWMEQPSVKVFDNIMKQFHEIVYGQTLE